MDVGRVHVNWFLDVGYLDCGFDFLMNREAIISGQNIK